MRYERKSYSNKAELQKALKYFVENDALFVLREKGKEKVIGQISLTKTMPPFNNEYNIGYILHNDFQGMGYCTEASNAVMEYGFNVLHVHRIRAACNPENIGSWKVMEKLGMKKEAHFTKRVCFHTDDVGNPIYTDEFVYAMNSEDYKDN